jgi:outer membrane lipopolysaccharide assembly protein LptE/RlpB
MRTDNNDNDIAKKYFKNTNEILKQQKETAYLRNELDIQNENGNLLIQKLKQQSVDNADRNNLLVQRKTFENDQVTIFF